MGTVPHWLPQWNWIDVLALVCLLRFGYIGATQGLGNELVRTAGLVSGIVVAFRWYQPVGDWVAARTRLSHEWAAAFILIAMVFGVYLVLGFALRLAQKAVTLRFAPSLDKAGGVALALGRAMLVVSLALVTLQQLPSESVRASIEERSWSGRYLARVAPAIYDTVTPWVARVMPAALTSPRGVS
ncbi:MAG: CvpA family protein [Candidatus Omnitrophica bacterium]|nr:CvpA family protein [Candidatus Omnitrophota bacterium]